MPLRSRTKKKSKFRIKPGNPRRLPEGTNGSPSLIQQGAQSCAWRCLNKRLHWSNMAPKWALWRTKFCANIGITCCPFGHLAWIRRTSWWMASTPYLHNHSNTRNYLNIFSTESPTPQHRRIYLTDTIKSLITTIMKKHNRLRLFVLLALETIKAFIPLPLTRGNQDS